MFKFLKQIIIVIVVIGITAYIVQATGKYTDKIKEDDLADGCSADMVFVPNSEGGFCIDIYEASVGEDCPYENPDKQDKTRVNLDAVQCKPISVKDAIPWRFISQNQASLACSKAGKRLASNKEWHNASLGTPDPESGWTDHDCQINNNWGQQPGFTGSGRNCISSAGGYDMIGNAWEWVEGSVVDGKFNNVLSIVIIMI